ncbi:MAG: hypothetical protein JXQ73_03575 [Phycisphaerae bacterium]|nr:hypothetical protein [Phycisphaerae bacterium]
MRLFESFRERSRAVQIGLAFAVSSSIAVMVFGFWRLIVPPPWGYTLWEILECILVFFGLPAMVLLQVIIALSLRRPGRCPGCGYSLRGLSRPRCPECGRAFTFKEVLSTPEQLGYAGTVDEEGGGET